MPTREPRARVARNFHGQAAACESLGSPLYADLLRRAAADVEAGGWSWDLVASHGTEPARLALALRYLAAFHELALGGSAPGLAAALPSTGGEADPDAAWTAMRALALDRGPEIRDALRRQVQTNEVGRAVAIGSGSLEVARRTGLPLALLELGASAGLNLRWDLYRWSCDRRTWGDAASPVDLGDPFAAGCPPAAAGAEVGSRRGCDLDPIDPATPGGRARLLSFVWPDMPDRLKLLEAAVGVARTHPVRVDRAAAGGWLRERLSEPRPGMATVVFHSVFIQYVEAEERAELNEAIAAAAVRAGPDAPLAHLRLEPVDGSFELWLRTWPGGADERLARTRGHGRPIWWDARG